MSTPSEGPLPVVLLHGIRLSGTMWRRVAAAVAEHRPVGVPDLPGHGRRRGEPFTMDAAADAVAETIDGLGGRALVAGLSLGGYVAMATAARHPERVAGLVPMGCTLRPEGWGAACYRTVAGLAARYPRWADRLSAAAFRRTLPGPLADDVLAGGLSCEAMPQAVAAMEGSRPPEPLAAYDGPVWFVNGENDPFRAHEREFLRACRDARLLLLPRRGHVTALMETAEITRILLDAATALDRCPDLSTSPPTAR
ncbi:alpha/beta fold hydrolase [Actinocorallia populi]|uniref:alpha/beta fold hydrolase n=1 Tax=Actinocorallia populi TaxID=2079200 RepID=UPI000D0873E2|nr:alpha/beta hydrolase [Actinocorallia populi]